MDVTGRVATLRFWLPVVTCWAVPVVALVVVVPLSEQRHVAALAQDPSPTVLVAERSQTFRQSVDLVFTMPEVASARVGEAGVVTAVHVTGGEAVAQGAAVVSVDGVVRRAYRDLVPQHRELGVGDTGEDVAALHDFLTQVAGTEVRGQRYTAATARAVRAYQTSVGASPDGRFRPGLVIYLPTGAWTVGAVRAEAGAVLEAQAVVFDGSARPSGMRVEGAEGATVDALALDAPVVVGWKDVSQTFGSGDWTEEEVGVLYDAVRAGVSAGDGTAGQESAETRVTGARIELESPRAVGAVPGTAVLTTSGGARCVFLVDGAGADAPRAVELSEVEHVVGELGIAAVGPELVGSTVVRDPAALPAKVQASCG